MHQLFNYSETYVTKKNKIMFSHLLFIFRIKKMYHPINLQQQAVSCLELGVWAGGLFVRI